MLKKVDVCANNHEVDLGNAAWLTTVSVWVFLTALCGTRWQTGVVFHRDHGNSRVSAF